MERVCCICDRRNKSRNTKLRREPENIRDAGQPRALVSGLYDVNNDFFVDLQIEKTAESESETAKKHIDELKQTGIDKPVLVIMDRGYPSIEFIHFLEGQGIRYLLRLSSNDYGAERKRCSSNDEIIELEHTGSRLAKVKKNHPEEYEELKETKKTWTRLIRSTLPSGAEFAAVTNIPENITAQEICSEYFERWKIEESYNTLKNKLKFESVTGKAGIYVYQDFPAQMPVYNMIEDIKHCAEEQLKEDTGEKAYTYPVRINENMAVGLFKDRLIKLLIENDDIKRRLLFMELQADMEKYFLPVRKSESHERKFHPANKYMNNIKPAF